jgi:hypothetical protein
MQNNDDIYEFINDKIDNIYNSIEDEFIEDELSVYFYRNKGNKHLIGSNPIRQLGE